MKKILLIFILLPLFITAQQNIVWENVDSLFQPLPPTMHVYRTTSFLDGKPNIAYYVEVKLKDKKLDFTTDTTLRRRLTPAQFYQKNNSPLLVVNGTFFSFETNLNLNVVIKDKKIVAFNQHTLPGRGKDTLTYRHPLASAIGIRKDRTADVAWVFTDSTEKYPYATQNAPGIIRDSSSHTSLKYFRNRAEVNNGLNKKKMLSKWKMETAIGGGPVLVKRSEVHITNNEEGKFGGKAIDDKHPRTAMGTTIDGRLIIMAVQGRFPGEAEGASLTQLAQMLKDIGCFEALNLDGGGSSCLLINGKETIKPSDKGGQRPVPAVFIIQEKK